MTNFNLPLNLELEKAFTVRKTKIHLQVCPPLNLEFFFQYLSSLKFDHAF